MWGWLELVSCFLGVSPSLAFSDCERSPHSSRGPLAHNIDTARPYRDPRTAFVFPTSAGKDDTEIAGRGDMGKMSLNKQTESQTLPAAATRNV